MLEIEVSSSIDAPPERVWELIGDPTNMGRWSPGCRRVEWTGGHRGGLITALGRLGRGVGDVESHNCRGMEETVARIKAAAEQPTA